MSARDESVDARCSKPDRHTDIERLAALGPEAQGDIDETLLLENLERTPFERLQAVSEAARQIELLQQAVKAAGHA